MRVKSNNRELNYTGYWQSVNFLDRSVAQKESACYNKTDFLDLWIMELLHFFGLEERNV